MKGMVNLRDVLCYVQPPPFIKKQLQLLLTSKQHGKALNKTQKLTQGPTTQKDGNHPQQNQKCLNTPKMILTTSLFSVQLPLSSVINCILFCIFKLTVQSLNRSLLHSQLFAQERVFLFRAEGQFRIAHKIVMLVKIKTGFVPFFGLKIQGLFKDIFFIFQGLHQLQNKRMFTLSQQRLCRA